MKSKIAIRKSYISTVLLLGMAAALVAQPSISTAAPHSDSTSKQIQACVAEIGKHADYDEAVRATHLVERLQQQNLAELRIEIETLVYVGTNETLVRSYKTSCVTDLSRKVVEFRMAQTDNSAA